MALGGAMFNFDKINKIFGGGKGNAPVIADVMASRWAYEALAVTQFKNNRYERNFFDIEQIESQSNYQQAFYLPELHKIINESVSLLKSDNDESRILLTENLNLLKNEFGSEIVLFNDIPKMDIQKFSVEEFNGEVAQEARDYLRKLEDKYIKIFNTVSQKKDNLILSFEEKVSGKDNYINFYDNYYNDFLAEIVKKTTEKNKIIRDNDRLVQNYEPIFLYPSDKNVFSLRAHFFAPGKYIFGMQVDTLWFNLIIIWMMSVIFYLTLYFDVLRKTLELGSRIGKTKINNK